MSETGVNEIAAGQYDTYGGCIPYDKANAFVLPGGAAEEIVFQFRDASGNPTDISKWFNIDNPNIGSNGVYARFSLADYSRILKYPVKTYIVDPTVGKVQFTLPPAVYKNSCIYSFQLSVCPHNLQRDPLYISHNRGVVLIEWTPFLHDNPASKRIVPLLEDVRRRLDDFTGKNDLLEETEYSADDILHAMVSPVRWFNEDEPELRQFRYTVADFPFYENWVHGTAAELLRRTVPHLVRNKLMAQHGGVAGDEKNRDRDYAQMSQQYIEEYRRWARSKKQGLNYRPDNGWGTIYSDYAFLG
jgi:hypothetical protein